MDGRPRPSRKGKIARRHGWRPRRGLDESEAARLPRRARGDPETLVGVESPDDVDLYRHDGPPPGFERAALRPATKDGREERKQEARPLEAPQMDEFKNLIMRAVGLAKGAGPSADTLTAVTSRLGDFLSRFADPADREQRLLKELWDVGTEEEQRTLARLVLKMAGDEKDNRRKH